MVKEIEKICPICKRHFEAFNKGRIYCSIRCQGLARRLDIGIAEREWKSLREFILERDNYTCQICGKFMMDVGLEVHHLKAVRNRGTNKETNLITLCHECHKRKHHLK